VVDRSTRDTDISLPVPAALLQQRLGPYAIDGIIGRGGMGVVYRGRSATGERVALKAIRPEIVSTALLDRFEREGAIRLDHPNVIRTLAAGWDATTGTPWIAFELLEGTSLEALLERRSVLPPAELVPILEGICAGVGAAHAQGIVHRDLKPANVFLCGDGRVKVLDFGIALVTSAARVTMDAQVLGTLAYLAPEQARGERNLDGRADVWAIGALAYEALLGRVPFEKAAPIATLMAILQDDPLPALRNAGQLPPALVETVARCLAKDREQRWPDASALSAALGASMRASVAPKALMRPRGSHLLMRTLRPGESRAVILLLAREVEDPEQVGRTIREAGGEVIVLLGREIVGIFGGSQWRGDEARRAVASAVSLRHLAHRMAVCSGHAHGVETGVSGDALDSAERACRLAVDGVAIDRNVAEALASRFLVAPADDGFLEILGEREAHDEAEVDARRARLVGRAAELDAAGRSIDAWVSGRAAAVVLEGPVGIGKSRLRSALEDRAHEAIATALVLSGRGEPSQDDDGPAPVESAFRLFASVLRRHARRRARERGWPMLRAEAPPLAQRQAILSLAREALPDRTEAGRCAEFLGELLGVRFGASAELAAARLDPALMADRIRGSLHQYAQGLLSQGALVLSIDDLQWVDTPSRELVSELLRQFADRPLLVIAARRASTHDTSIDVLPGATTIRIGPLATHDVALLASEVAGAELGSTWAELLVDRTGGNPLFVEHVALALRDRGELERRGSDTAVDRLPVPFTVEAAIQARFDELDEPSREATRYASVFGRPIGPVDLAALGVAAPYDMLAGLVRAEILEPQSDAGASGGLAYRFTSELFATTAYRSIERDARAALHGRAAAHLAAQVGHDAEEVAAQYERALAPQLAAAFYADAARDAASQGDMERVLRCASRALEMGPPESALYALHLSRADAFRFLRRRAEQSDALAAALDLARTPLERARVLSDRSLLAMHAARYVEATVTIERALAEATLARDADTMAIAHARRAEIALRAGEVAVAAAAVIDGRRIAPRAGPVARGHVASAAANLALVSGDIGTAVAEYADAASSHRAGGDLRRAAGAEGNLADQYNRVGAYADAERRLRACLEACRRVGNRVAEGYALANLGYALTGLGRERDAVEVLDRAREASAQIADERLALTVRLYHGRALWGAGEPRAALDELLGVASEARQNDHRALAAQSEAIAARISIALGRTAEALALSGSALQGLDRSGAVGEDEAEIFVARAEAFDRTGDVEQARAIRREGASRLRELAQRISDPVWRARFLEGPQLHRALLDGA
jgi:predicted ATPase